MNKTSHPTDGTTQRNRQYSKAGKRLRRLIRKGWHGWLSCWRYLGNHVEVVLTGVIALSTTIYAIVSSQQLTAMRSQLKEMATQSALSNQSTTMNRHATEATHGAKVFFSHAVASVPHFLPGKDWPLTIDFQNGGEWQASRVSIGLNIELVDRDGGGGSRPKLPLPCFQKSEQIISARPPEKLEDPSNHCWPGGVVVSDDLIRSHKEYVFSGFSRPEVYGVVMYWNGVCLRCKSFCYALVLHPDQSTPDLIQGDILWNCGHSPHCSRFGNYDEATECLQEDISDELGYYPESDEDGMKAAAGCPRREVRCTSNPDWFTQEKQNCD